MCKRKSPYSLVKRGVHCTFPQELYDGAEACHAEEYRMKNKSVEMLL